MEDTFIDIEYLENGGEPKSKASNELKVSIIWPDTKQIIQELSLMLAIMLDKIIVGKKKAHFSEQLQ